MNTENLIYTQIYLETSIEVGRPTMFADDTRIFITGNNANDVKNKINTHKLV
jgi:hypothetical protein